MGVYEPILLEDALADPELNIVRVKGGQAEQWATENAKTRHRLVTHSIANLKGGDLSAGTPPLRGLRLFSSDVAITSPGSKVVVVMDVKCTSRRRGEAEDLQFSTRAGPTTSGREAPRTSEAFDVRNERCAIGVERRLRRTCLERNAQDTKLHPAIEWCLDRKFYLIARVVDLICSGPEDSL